MVNLERKTTASDIIKYIYLFFIFGVYPLYLSKDHYFNITITKYRFFLVTSVVMLVLCCMVAFWKSFQSDTFEGAVIKQKWYQDGRIYMLIFLVCNFIAVFMAPDKNDAISGKEGRYMGFLLYLVLAAVFLVLADYNRMHILYIMYIFAFSSAVAFIIAIKQHTGEDFLGLKAGISQKQYDIFMSTFGNINIFASYLTISVPAFLAMFIFSKKIINKMISTVILLLGGMCLMIANSDSGYVGVVAALGILFFVCLYYYRICEYMWSITVLLLGNYMSVIFNQLYVKDYDMRGGVAEALDNVKIAVLLVVCSLIASTVLSLIWYLKKEAIMKWNRKFVMLVFAVLAVIAICVVIILGVHKKLSLFTFNYKWGTYRGYIWSKIVELYKNAPFINKLFGYGNESVKFYMKQNFYNEMINVTGRVYDNSHNEVLQYLITTGIFGAISYIGLFVSAVIYMFKQAAKTIKTVWMKEKTSDLTKAKLEGYENLMMVMVCLASATGYFAQGLINLNQPITTPLFFVVLGMGVGVARKIDVEVMNE